MKLKWQRRIYDARGFHPSAKSKVNMHTTVELDPDAYTCNIPVGVWENIQQAIITNNLESLSDLTDEVVQLSDMQENQHVQEITSEMKDISIVKHHASFSKELRQASVVLVQMVAECRKGLMRPTMRLLNFTNECDMCIQHMQDPVSCFADVATNHMKLSYTEIENYQRVILPILNMEAACNSMAESDPIVISNEQISLRLSNGKYYGQLQLPMAYCKPRHIMLLRNSKDEESDFHDFMCLRCPFTDETDSKQMWVGHAVQTKAATSKEGDVIVDFGIHYMNERPPVLLTTGRTACHIELLA